MPKTVNGAFNDFMLNKINLDKERTKKARNSRDWLIIQIKDFPTSENDFPLFHPDLYIYFGSFARKTKRRPLDDIDIIVVLNAQGNTYFEYYDKIEITVPDTADRQLKLCHDDTNKLNSIKVINKFIKKLSNIDQYKNAEINRNQEAATLQLKSYEWNFDIVPAFITTKDANGKDYYLIPDGTGNWKKTDPRINKNRVTEINQKHKGYVLPVIRAIKYWNKRPTMPSMGSYLLENIILNYYDNKIEVASQYVDIEIVKILNYIKNVIYYPVNDPKGIQGNINTLTLDEKTKISNRATLDLEKAKTARQYESDEEHEKSINKWKEVFGEEFPKYE